MNVFLQRTVYIRYLNIMNDMHQHYLKIIPAQRKVATSQTSELLVGKAPKTCNSYPDSVFK